MSSYLRKCIDIAPTGVISPELNPANDYRRLREQSWWPALRATTSWLRLWADWPSLQRVDGPPGTGTLGAMSVDALDRQIDAARADGLQIILMPYRYPKWTNGTEGRVYGNAEDDLFETWNRVARLSAYLTWRAGGPTKPTYKNHEYRLPTDGFGQRSRWAGFVEWLWDRYETHVAAFEVVNEPNLQLWPQRTTIETDDFNARWTTDGTMQLATPAVADMIVTMDAIARRRPAGPLLLAPSVSDSDIDDIPRSTTISHPTQYTPDATDWFLPSLFDHLEQRGFAGGEHWVWSFHNYADIERKQHHVADMRRLLIERGWAGRRLDGGPEMWATEGGCRLTAPNARFGLPGMDRTYDQARLDYQARVLHEGLSRHHYAKGDGTGVGLITQYTTYADGFNSGILEGNGTPRPALAVWSAMPEFHAAPTQRAAWRPQF